MYPSKGIRTSFKKPSTTTQQQISPQTPSQAQVHSKTTISSSTSNQQHQQQQSQQHLQKQQSVNKMGKRDIKRGMVQRTSDAGGK